MIISNTSGEIFSGTLSLDVDEDINGGDAYVSLNRMEFEIPPGGMKVIPFILGIQSHPTWQDVPSGEVTLLIHIPQIEDVIKNKIDFPPDANDQN